MCAILPLEGKNLSYVRLKFSSQNKWRALIDTGSCADALPECLFIDLNWTNSKSLTWGKASFIFVRTASGQNVPIDKRARTSSPIGPHHFHDLLLVLRTLNGVILGNPFFIKHNFKIFRKNNLLQLRSLSVILNRVLPKQGKNLIRRKKLPKTPPILTQKRYKLRLSHKYY